MLLDLQNCRREARRRCCLRQRIRGSSHRIEGDDRSLCLEVHLGKVNPWDLLQSGPNGDGTDRAVHLGNFQRSGAVLSAKGKAWEADEEDGQESHRDTSVEERGIEGERDQRQGNNGNEPEDHALAVLNGRYGAGLSRSAGVSSMVEAEVRVAEAGQRGDEEVRLIGLKRCKPCAPSPADAQQYQEERTRAACRGAQSSRGAGKEGGRCRERSHVRNPGRAQLAYSSCVPEYGVKPTMKPMTIGQLAAAGGVNVESVRYYQRRGLLDVPERAPGEIARYSEEALQRLQFIKRSQALGFSLADVQALLSLEDGQSCAAARGIGEGKLAETRERIKSLQALERALSDLVDQCAASRRKVSCPLIRALMDATSAVRHVERQRR